MSININSSEKSLSVDIGAPGVMEFFYTGGGSKIIALTKEPNGPVAIGESDNWLRSEDGGVFFGADESLIRTTQDPDEVIPWISVSDSEIVITGPRPAIDVIKVNGVTFDFTLPSISAVESASGRNLQVSGFAQEDDIFEDPEAVYMSLREAMEQRRFTMTSSTDLLIMEGRSNRQALRFTPDVPDGLPLINGSLDTSDPRFEKFEIISGVDSGISSIDDNRMRRGEYLVVELGSLKVDLTTSVDLSVIAYIYGDEKGIVLTASEKVPLAKASVVKRRYRTQVVTEITE